MSNRHKQRRWALAAAISALVACGTGVPLAIAGTFGSTSNPGSIVSRVLANTVPRVLADARELGLLAPAQRISLLLPLALPHQAALNAYVAGEYTPGNPDYRRFLTPAQFGQRFGAPASELEQTLNALHGLGLSGAAPTVNHLYVRATGTVAAVEQAFGVQLARFRLGSLPAFYSNLQDITLPAVLGGLVSGVVGLDSSGLPQSQLTRGEPNTRSHLAQPNLGTLAGVDGGATPCTQAGLGGGYTAPDLATAYGFDGLYAKGLHGEGMSAALVEFDDYHDSNVAAVESCYGLHTPVTRRLVDGGTGGPPGPGEAEDMSDITTLLEMAPKLAHLYVYEAPITGEASVLNQGAAEIDLYNAFVTDDLAPVLSSSWGNCEELQSQSYDDLFATVAEEAAAQGQQIFAAAGDSGAVDCRGSATPTSGSISVEQEAAVPWVTAVGGTDLGVESTVSGLGIHNEDTWNDSGAGGGGQSAVWAMPAWQAAYLAAAHDTPPGAADGCGAPAGGLCRMVPDIALDADPDAGGLVNQGPLPPQFFGRDVGSSGYATYCETSNCSFTSEAGLPIPIGLKPPAGAGGWYPIGGTSLATPLAASAAVLWDQEAKRDGLGGVGFLNPSLYRVASNPRKYTADFHDITTDSNDAQYDTTDCPAGCNPHHLYAAGTGYDMATGLGSFNATTLGADLIADAGSVDLTPNAETVYGYRNGPATTDPVSITSGFRSASYRARSSSRWLIVSRAGGVPGTLKWHVNPKGLALGAHSGRIKVTGTGGSTAVLSVSYTVTRRAKISVSPGSLHFSERAIDGSGNTTAPTCAGTVWNDELKTALNGPDDTTAVDASTRRTLTISNKGPAGSVLHYDALLYTYTGSWLTQDLNPNGNAIGFQTVPSQPLVATTGTLARGQQAQLKLASVANENAVGGYPSMNQGTYPGVVQIRDLSDPSVVRTVPVTLTLGSGDGTPTIAATPGSITVALAPGTLARVNLGLRDASSTCGYAYSLQGSTPWATFAPDLQSGSVGPSPATSAPTGATDTGAGNGFTPIVISAAGLEPGTYHAHVTVQSQNAAANPTTVPITVNVFGARPHKPKPKRKHRR